MCLLPNLKTIDGVQLSRRSLVQHAPTKTAFEIFARPDMLWMTS